MSKLLREPLIHFILIGALLFAGHKLWSQWVSRSDYTIYVSDAEIRRQAEIFASENQRQPTDEDIQGLIFAHVEEQILMREAERLGLGEDDTIIRRRLAQKMRFMINEDTPPPLPNEAELKHWFEENSSQFVTPARRAFTHAYFSPGNHDDVEQAANSALETITDENWPELSDPFIENSLVPLTDKQRLAQLFGNNFTKELFDLPVTREWQGPISSAFGMHLIRIDNTIDRQEPEFDAVRENVENVWRAQNLSKANEQRLIDLLGKYEVKVEGVDP